MGLGRAIVASDLEQIGEVIEHERTGLLCPPGDGEAAAGEVHRLLGDADLRGRMARTGAEIQARDGVAKAADAIESVGLAAP